MSGIPGVFGHGRLVLVTEAACVLMFLNSGAEGPLCLSDVDFPTGTRDTIHHVGLLCVSQPVLHGLVSCWRRVLRVLNVVLILYFQAILLMSSLSPAVYAILKPRIIRAPKITFLANRELLKFWHKRTQFRELIKPGIDKANTVVFI